MKTIKQIIHSILYRLYVYMCPDKIYLNNKFKEVFGRNINWKQPTTFNEKLQWLKIYDRKPEYSMLVDKYEVRKYITEKVGRQYLFPCLGIWNSVDGIDFDSLPKQFVLKCTHDSHSVIICRDKDSFNIEAAKKQLASHMKFNFYYNAREWPYKYVKPRIIGEKYMTDGDEALIDYKFFCFDGEPMFMYISNDAGIDPRTDFFDMDFNHLPIQMKDPPADVCPEKPKQFDTMRYMAKTLSAGHKHLRVDFYIVNNCIYVGELTFYHCSGFSKITPEEWDKKIGDMIRL